MAAVGGNKSGGLGIQQSARRCSPNPFVLGKVLTLSWLSSDSLLYPSLETKPSHFSGDGRGVIAQPHEVEENT